MSLHVRLALATAVLLLLTALVLAPQLTYFAQRYESEVTQQLNAGVAMYVTEELRLLDPTGVNDAALRDLAHRVMTVNPSAEVYLLDLDGRIAATLVRQDRLRKHRVDLQPLQDFMDESRRFPIYGDDPTSASARGAVFSAAPVMSDGQARGYLYVVIGGKQQESVLSAIRSSYTLQTGLLFVLTIIVIAIGAGAVLFRILTLPLRRLRDRMRDWSTTIGGPSDASQKADLGDEISTLTQHFELLKRQIALHLQAIKRHDSERREFIAGISHDLRTPLATLHGYLETIALKDHELGARERRHYLEIACKHSTRLQQLTAALFELSKLESGAIVVSPEPFSLIELIHDIALRFRLRAEQCGVQIAVSAETNVPAHADIALIERALENLIDNALRHTPAGGTIRLHVDRIGERLRIDVTDTGPGLSASQLLRVRALGLGQRGLVGDGGLGLAVVSKIAELHGGQLSAHGKSPTGAVLSLTLQVATMVTRIIPVSSGNAAAERAG